MKNLEMTRVECANQIARLSASLRYHVDRVSDLVCYEDRDMAEELTHEIDLRQDLQTLQYLMSVMIELV